MDHWGDPWADDADNFKPPPPKEEVKPPTPTIPSAPAVLNGFLDDAQWGNFGQEEEFGGWSNSPAEPDVVHASDTETRVLESNLTSITSEFEDPGEPTRSENNGGFALEDEGWGSIEQVDFSKETDNVVSEPSDSATTVQPDDIPDRVSENAANSVQPDDDQSTRSSTSPSDISHTEAPSDSPRTSFEEERISGKLPLQNNIVLEEKREEEQAGPVQEDDRQTKGQTSGEGPLLKDGDLVNLEQDQLESTKTSSGNEDTRRTSMDSDDHHPTEESYTPRAITLAIPGLNVSLLADLFPATNLPKRLPTAPDDPVSSTSTRKAWYRLTRKQTLREFNNGQDDDNYVRVTWRNSHIRSEVNKIVGKWATEDRYSGRGSGAGANFFWDQAPKPDSKSQNTHARNKVSISASSPIRPVEQDVPPLSTDMPVAFSWSSPAMGSQDPWKHESSDQGLSSRIAPTPTATLELPLKPEIQPISDGLTSPPTSSRKNEAVLENKTAPVTPATEQIQSLEERDPWSDISALDTDKITPKMPAVLADAAANNEMDKDEDEDEDEWGDMVGSPTVETSTPIVPSPQSPSPNPSTITPSSTPKTARVSPFQTPASKHASPIVRLKGMVSPTSAQFRFNAFVPPSLEDGPIGPALLKRPGSKPVLERTTSEEKPAVDSTEKVVDDTGKPTASNGSPENFAASKIVSPEEIQETAAEDDFSAFEASPPSPALSPDPPEPPVSAPAFVQDLPAEPTTDSWSDTDFTSFEKRQPVPEPAPVSTLSFPDQSTEDSWSSPGFAAPEASTTTPVSVSTSSQQSAADPWSNIDFSFFESAPPPPSTTTKAAIIDPSDPLSFFDTPSPSPVPFTRPPPRSATPPSIQPLTSATNSAQRRKAEEDDTIRSIVEGLPDLSYMLLR